MTIAEEMVGITHKPRIYRTHHLIYRWAFRRTYDSTPTVCKTWQQDCDEASTWDLRGSIERQKV